MPTSQAPRLERTPLLRFAFVPWKPFRLHAVRKAEVRARRSCVSPQAFIAELSLPDTATATEALFTSAPDPQKLTIAALGTVGLILLAAVGFALQLSPSKRVTSLSPAKLKDVLSQKETLFIDIRSKSETKAMGVPSLKGLKARSRTLPFTKATKEGQEPIVKGFGELFGKMKGLKEDSIVVLMDGDGRLATTAAQQILEFTDLQSIYCVSGGAAALQASGFEWRSPSEGLSLSLPKLNLKGLDLDKVAESYKQRPTLFNTGLAASALLTAAVVLFNEFDIVLETVGVLGGVQLLFKRFFFAEDRQKTIKELRLLFDEKIAAAEAGDDLKRLASAILEVSGESRSEAKAPSPAPVSSIAASEETNNKVPIGETTF